MPTKKTRSLTAEGWIAAAQRIMVTQGIEHVKVQRLARMLGVTRGSFYWHFTNRQHLMDELLALWRRTNTGALAEAIADTSRTLEQHVLALFTLWLAEKDFDPRFDAAVRDWARKAPRTRAAVRAVDSERITRITRIFSDASFSPQEARIRAMVLYYTQIGYYTVDLQESLAERLSHTAAYIKVFIGRPPTAASHAAFLTRFDALVRRTRKRA